MCGFVPQPICPSGMPSKSGQVPLSPATAANFALFTRVVDATGHTDPMMELQKRGPSARAWLAIAAALAIVAVGVRFVR